MEGKAGDTTDVRRSEDMERRRQFKAFLPSHY